MRTSSGRLRLWRCPLIGSLFVFQRVDQPLNVLPLLCCRERPVDAVACVDLTAGHHPLCTMDVSYEV